MRFKVLSVFAALLLVAACESAPESSGAATGSGAAAGSGGQPAMAGQARPGSVADFVTNVGDRVFFDFDSANVTPQGAETLRKQAAWLKKYPSVTLSVEGHCDERGTREYNLALGERRASAVRDFLVGQGITANRVTTITYGKEKPEVVGSTEWAWSQNRRGVSVPKNAPAS